MDQVKPMEVCVLTHDAATAASASAACAKAGVVFAHGRGCAVCKEPCKPIVAIDLTDPEYMQSIRGAHSHGGARVLIAIAPESTPTQKAKDQGFQFVVYRPLMDRFMATVLRIASSLMAS